MPHGCFWLNSMILWIASIEIGTVLVELQLTTLKWQLELLQLLRNTHICSYNDSLQCWFIFFPLNSFKIWFLSVLFNFDFES